MGIHITAVFTYGLLICAIVCLWVDARKQLNIQLCPIILIGSAVVGLIFGYLNLIGIATVLLMLLILYYKEQSKNNFFLKLVLLIVACFLFCHKFPGFINYNVFINKVISKNGIPYSLYLNFDKALIGIFIFSIYNNLAVKLEDWKEIFKTFLVVGTITTTITVGLSYVLGYVTFEPKIVDFLPIWMVSNLWLVVIPEEALFRMFLQNQLGKVFKQFKNGKWLALLLASILFGMAHFAGGIKYIIIATGAGLGYGYAYQKTQKIEAAVLVHFFLNLIHIIFFTYPALRTAF